MRFPITDFRIQVPSARAATGGFSRLKKFAAFSLVEVLVAMSLLTLIVLALMNVFSDTQKAFRASVTQTDVLEGARNAADLIANDLRQMVPSGGVSNFNINSYGAVNFFATNNDSFYQGGYHPLVQSLPASSTKRSNLLQWFFILGRKESRWTGTGYAVDSGSTTALYPLYRFYQETDSRFNPIFLYWNFSNALHNARWTNMSHIMDGVTHLVVRAQDLNGTWMTNGYGTNQPLGKNIWYSPPQWGEVGFTFYSNTLPAAVELQMGIIEDRTLQRAEALPNTTARSNYLSQQAGHVHLFHQLIRIPNVDPSAYQ